MRGRTALVVSLTLAVVAALLVVTLWTREPSTDRRTSSPLIGELAPLVAGDTLSGEGFELDRQRGRWVVVNFFARWCVPCRREHPELVQFSEAHAERGDAVVVSVIYDDTEDNVRSLFEELGGDWPVVNDVDGRIALDYGVTGVPESYLVAPDGTVVAKVLGGVTAQGLDDLIDRASGGAT